MDSPSSSSLKARLSFRFNPRGPKYHMYYPDALENWDEAREALRGPLIPRSSLVSTVLQQVSIGKPTALLFYQGLWGNLSNCDAAAGLYRALSSVRSIPCKLVLPPAMIQRHHKIEPADIRTNAQCLNDARAALQKEIETRKAQDGISASYNLTRDGFAHAQWLAKNGSSFVRGIQKAAPFFNFAAMTEAPGMQTSWLNTG